ncbi:putative MATE family efflux protein [Clostridium pascui]|uniref:MATE family efflux transporter n=1 Tax=Clostridium pascui TaxID=46609 RepID=UPI00195A3E8C|nr:MATE family efflux transporter [Clostridium pascui]MBM7871766.1 putative MATE family efflux protein [Clostridium pascui]
MNFRTLFLDKKFYKTSLKLALPIATQNLILSSLNLVDTIMIGRLGETAIASVGLANQYFFLLNLLLFGVVSGSSIFTAQYWGNRDLPNIKRILGLCLCAGIFTSILFTLGGLVFPKQILSIFSKDIEVINLGSTYLKIAVLSYTITSITFAYSFVLRSTGNVKLPMFVSTIALGTNTILNYMFIFGNFGAPSLGVPGAALATLIARLVEVLLLLSIVYKTRSPIGGTIKEMLDLPSELIRKFFKVTTPVILNESVWALGATMYAVVYARMGTEVIASTNIVSTIERIALVIFWGFGNAAAVIIGNKIGSGNEDEAFMDAIRFITLNPILAMLAGIVIFLGSPFLLSAYNVSPIVHEYSRNILKVLSFCLWVKVFNYTNIVGILRSGGDTKYCLLLDVGGMWLVGVPLVCFAGLYLKLPIHYVYIFVYTEEVFKFLVGLPRIASKKWINNLVIT